MIRFMCGCLFRAVMLGGVLGGVFVGVLGGVPAPGHAQEAVSINHRDSFGLLRKVHLDVVDQVSDGCWTNVERIRQRVRLILESSGVRVYREPIHHVTPFAADLMITGIGYKTGAGLCVGIMEISATKESSYAYGEMAKYRIDGKIQFFNSSMVISGEGDLNVLFADYAETRVSEFAADIISRSRSEPVRELLDEHEEQVEADPLTVEEWRRIRDRREEAQQSSSGG